MILAPILAGLAIAATVWLSALLAVSVRRRAPLGWLLAALALFCVANGAVLARFAGPSDAPWDALWLASFLLAHAGVAIFAITYLPSGRSRWRVVASAGIALLGGGLAVVGIAAGWRISDAFQPATEVGLYSMSAFPIACLAVALGESLAALRQSPHRRQEAWLMVMGTVALLVGGPVYGFELTILGQSDFAGTNLAVPVAVFLFAQALLGANPLPFRGRPASSTEVPWAVRPGVYLLDEVRPAYAEAMFLAVSGTEPALAIAGPGAPRPELIGVETVRLPPGERCAPVLAATALEFLARNPRGAVLLDDVSYAVTHSGPVTVVAIRSVIRGMPEGASVVVSLAKLSSEERAAFRALPGAWLSPPEFHGALASIFRNRFAASGLLPRAARAKGKRPQDLTVSDVPSLLDHVRAVLHGLRAPSDRAAEPGWSWALQDLGADLERFWRTPPSQMTVRTLASPEATLGGLGLVKASSIVGLDPPASGGGPPPPLGEAIRDTFVANLGAAGDPVYRRVLRKLRKETSSIGAEDLANVARLADEVLSDIGGALDVPEAGRDLGDRSKRLRAQLAGLAGEGR